MCDRADVELVSKLIDRGFDLRSGSVAMAEGTRLQYAISWPMSEVNLSWILNGDVADTAGAFASGPFSVGLTRFVQLFNPNVNLQCQVRVPVESMCELHG